MNLLGIAPGGLHAGLCVLNPQGEVLDAATFSRTTRETSAQWVEHVMSGLDRVLERYGPAAVVISDIPRPRTYASGKLAGGQLDAAVILDTRMLVGAVLGGFDSVTPVPADRVVTHTHPQVLVGRRPVRFSVSEHPKNSRVHEQRAFNVAMTGRKLP